MEWLSDITGFIYYYCRLRLDVATGRRTTQYPLGPIWRYRNWKIRQEYRRQNPNHQPRSLQG